MLIEELSLPPDFNDLSIFHLQSKTENLKKETKSLEQLEGVQLARIYPERAREKISLEECLAQIQPLTDQIIRDVNDCASTVNIPDSILRRARGMVFLAMVYELCSIIDPQTIAIPFLNRICGTNMQGFFCVCKWQAAFVCETAVLSHLKGQHNPLL